MGQAARRWRPDLAMRLAHRQIRPVLAGHPESPSSKMMDDPDQKRIGRVFGAMMQMVKLDMPVLQKAYDGA